ncbi:ABC transporter ATP-binding protein [Amycolatopsis sp. FDAARGOS 1241]|uniref:ABC transporter ATP-binding protein n=1 Tax=Amycolatopsis sp. FDAARGOS 1241 TaxID=2778070 RepID=UPI00195269E8|nr:ATP-binding cassette domain-containing protein [Amycolatopsis sp. FDAARGOS 1241]QRP46095.1 ATP-binding cassette domain-containing protein [Amycolatopsis sp. FDAARGOS 1241]
MLHVQGLVKVYDGRRVVENVSFTLQPGTVTAFLGPNGAGKSTTLRMICGLTRPTAGSATIAGRRFAEWPNPGHVAGVLLDASAVHPGRTGRHHLVNGAKLMRLPAARADQVLAQVGLSDAANRRIGKYSLGMRQRLGLAHALLADPPVLILDEPINGLDPEGIRSTRQLLRAYAQRGGTVLLSSHVLSEVDQTADRIVMIGHGRVVADGPLASFAGPARTVVRTTDVAKLGTALQRAGLDVRQTGPDALSVAAPTDRVSEIAFAAQVRVLGLAEEQQNLEELFFRLTGGPR